MNNPYMQNTGAGGSPNQMNVGMAGVAEGAPMFGSIGAMGSQMQQPMFGSIGAMGSQMQQPMSGGAGSMGSQMQQPMFGNSSMNRSPMGGMGQQRSSEYTPIPGQPGYYTNPDNYRYKKKGPNYYQPADPMPQPPPNMFRIPNIFDEGPNKLDPELIPYLNEAYPIFDFGNPYLFEHSLPEGFKLDSGLVGTLIEENPFTTINIANSLGYESGNELIDKMMAWLDTEHGQMFMQTYQDAIDDK